MTDEKNERGKKKLTDDEIAEITGGYKVGGDLQQLFPLDLRPPCPHCGGTSYDFDRASTECPDYFDAYCMSCNNYIEVTPWNGKFALFCSRAAELYR